jgi:photosystem II stability/assembly factor-like uncharacterized protein
MRFPAAVLLAATLAGCQADETGQPAPVSAWIAQQSGTSANLRGLSGVSDGVAWASGSDGTFVRTTDGGATWQAGTVPGATERELRDVEAFDAGTALLLTAGEPAKIFKTTDGGQTWVEKYSNDTPGVFFNSMAFWDSEAAVAFSDPVEGSFLIIRTTNGGETWEAVPPENLPSPLPGEAGFAASGTMVAVQGETNAWMGTGGGTARVLRSTDRGRNWATAATPMRSGIASTGIFSLTFVDALQGIAVGGDYRDPESREANAALTVDGGRTWTPVQPNPPLGFRSCVAYVPGTKGRTLVSVGTSGSDVSFNGGKSWTALGEEGFHVVAFSPSGETAWAAGSDGRIAKLNKALLIE